MTNYCVGVDVTRSIHIYVSADNEKEAEKIAIVEADLDSTTGAGAWVKSEVHFINEED
jgi:hypothetical protein